MAKKINLTQLKNWRGIDVEIKDGKDEKGNDKFIPATIKDSIEGFLIFLDMNFRPAMTMDDWKVVNRLQKYVSSAKDSVLIIEDNEYDWLKKKLEEIPPKAATNKEVVVNGSYGGLAFGVDVITVLEALNNLVKE